MAWYLSTMSCTKPDAPAGPLAGPQSWELGDYLQPERAVPSVEGVLTGSDVLRTGEYISSLQETSGAISWPDGHTNAWDQVECAMALSACGLSSAARRAYTWLRGAQRSDGSWPRRTEGGRVTDPAGESNQSAYVAVGTWHEFLVTGDEDFVWQMWSTVYRAIQFCLKLQTERGEVVWEQDANGRPAKFALLAGCSSIYHSLKCAVALAKHIGQPQPIWEQAANLLQHAIACHPEAFADKKRFSMDWYYPVLAGPLRGAAGIECIEEQWAHFVVPGIGVRCVSDQPWVTGAESCELVLALDALGDYGQALAIFKDIQHLRDAEGAYWTGWQFENEAHFPNERSSWTAAAVILAADALSQATGGSGVFRDAGVNGVEQVAPRACARACCVACD
jgi:hypothetical protein